MKDQEYGLPPSVYLLETGKEDSRPGEEGLAIYLFFSGRASVQMGEGEPFPVRSGQVLLCLPGERPLFRTEKGESLRFQWLCLGMEGQEDPRRVWEDLTGEERLLTPAGMEVLREASRELAMPREPSLSESFRRASTLYLFLSYLFGSEGKQAKKSDKVYVEMAEAYIASSYPKGLKVQELASRIGISRYYLSTIFRREKGVSPQEYLMNLRMERAAQFLRETRDPVKTVAEQVGYTDSLAFSKAFHRRYGLSPSEYRRGGG